jgi:hypothetical protein
MSYPSFSGSFDPVTRLVAHVPIKVHFGRTGGFGRCKGDAITGQTEAIAEQNIQQLDHFIA